MNFMFLLCVLMLHFGRSFSEKNKKSKWSNYRSLRVRKSLFHILLEKMIENSLINHWLDMDLRRYKNDAYVGTRKLLQTSGA